MTASTCTEGGRRFLQQICAMCLDEPVNCIYGREKRLFELNVGKILNIISKRVIEALVDQERRRRRIKAVHSL